MNFVAVTHLPFSSGTSLGAAQQFLQYIAAIQTLPADGRSIFTAEDPLGFKPLFGGHYGVSPAAYHYFRENHRGQTPPLVTHLEKGFRHYLGADMVNFLLPDGQLREALARNATTDELVDISMFGLFEKAKAAKPFDYYHWNKKDEGVEVYLNSIRGTIPDAALRNIANHMRTVNASARSIIVNTAYEDKTEYLPSPTLGKVVSRYSHGSHAPLPTYVPGIVHPQIANELQIWGYRPEMLSTKQEDIHGTPRLPFEAYVHDYLHSKQAEGNRSFAVWSALMNRSFFAVEHDIYRAHSTSFFTPDEVHKLEHAAKIVETAILSNLDVTAPWSDTFSTLTPRFIIHAYNHSGSGYLSLTEMISKLFFLSIRVNEML